MQRTRPQQKPGWGSLPAPGLFIYSEAIILRGLWIALDILSVVFFEVSHGAYATGGEQFTPSEAGDSVVSSDCIPIGAAFWYGWQFQATDADCRIVQFDFPPPEVLGNAN